MAVTETPQTMLASLSIHNVLVFLDQQIEFGAGLNILTGETGVGKSVLLDCLGFVIGKNRFPSLPPISGDNSEVSAVFRLPSGHKVETILDELSLPNMEELMLRRAVAPNGRISNYVNDRRCTTALLGRLGECLVEVHGQDTNRHVMGPAEQREWLDTFANCGHRVAELRSEWEHLQQVRREFERAEKGRREAKAERDYLSHACEEVARLDLKPGEEEKLSLRRSELRAFRRYGEELQQASLAIGSSGAEGMASDAIGQLQTMQLAGESQIGEAVEAIDRALVELNEAGRLLAEVQAGFESDPHELERVDDRLYTIRHLSRKHNVSVGQLPELAHSLETQLADICAQLARSDELPAVLAKQERQYNQLAVNLSAERRKAARRLDQRVHDELAPLHLGAARFTTEITQRKAGPEGLDEVRFVAATNASTPPGPIHQIASGGEFSRFMLALRVCSVSQSAGMTMIFDEVDRDVGGATADAIGRRLRLLSNETQVLAVTHSPQVAAYADTHLKMEKQLKQGLDTTDVHPLADDSRIAEIARMLSGKAVTDEAEAAAKVLRHNAQAASEV